MLDREREREEWCVLDGECVSVSITTLWGHIHICTIHIIIKVCFYVSVHEHFHVQCMYARQ